MNIAPDQLGRHLERKLEALYVVQGAEPLIAFEAADAIRAAARAAGYATREAHYVDARFDWARLEAGMDNLSLFGERRLVELHVASVRLGRGGPDRLAAFCSAHHPDTVLLAMLPELDWRDRKSAWFSALEQAGPIVLAEPIAPNRLPDWIARRLAVNGQHADAETLAYMAARVEGNLLAARQEIDKLALLAPRGTLTRDQVHAALTDVARFDLDQLVPALLGGDASRAARILQGLEACGEEPPRALWTLHRELRTLLALATAREAGRDLADAFRGLRIHASRQAGYRKALDRLSGAQCIAMLAQAARADRAIKGLSRDSGWQSLTRLALTLAGAQTLSPGFSF